MLRDLTRGALFRDHLIAARKLKDELGCLQSEYVAIVEHATMYALDEDVAFETTCPHCES
jgi:transcription initiation factor IIE alpha subunit